MRNILFTRASLKLTEEEWRNLQGIAAATSSLAPTGTTAGKPAWRTLIKRIADGELLVSRRANEAGEKKE